MKLLFLFGFVALACAAPGATPKESKNDILENNIVVNEIIRSHPRYRNTPDGPVPHSKPAMHATSIPSTHTIPTTHESVQISNSTTETNSTAEDHMTLKNEIIYLKEQFTKVRGEIDHWMDTPYHKTVILPALIGVSFGFLTILVYSILRKCCRACNKKCSRTYMGRRKRYDVGDMKNLLDRKHESDDGI